MEDARHNALIVLVKRMLELEYEDRIKPDDALRTLAQLPPICARSSSTDTLHPATNKPDAINARDRWRHTLHQEMQQMEEYNSYCPHRKDRW